jgi:hypothetical protein
MLRFFGVLASSLDAYRKVKQGGKAAGIDGESWEEFDKHPNETFM